jgi:O-antigen/teichoic acid export membrane protein
MRPVSLILSALPDVERPLMAQQLANGGPASAFRIVKEFRTAAGAIWLATIALAAALLTWFPHLLIKKDYALADVVSVLVLSSAIMALRSLRTPESVLLQAAGEFRKLAVAGGWAAGATLAATLVLLLTMGPVAALGGILVGDLVLTARVFALAKTWRQSQ